MNTPASGEITFITPALLRNLANCLDNGMTPSEVAKELRVYELILAKEISGRRAHAEMEKDAKRWQWFRALWIKAAPGSLEILNRAYDGPSLGCDYQGQEFGAPNYPDSVCIDGYLWDADSGNADPSGEGWIYTNGGDIPCPKCNAEAHTEYYAEEVCDE